MRYKLQLLLAAIALTLLIGIAYHEYTFTLKQGSSKNLLVYVPPVLYKPVSEYTEVFERTSRVKVYVSVGATGVLISRVESTREGDVLFTADHLFMEKAISKGLVDSTTVRVVSYLIPAILVRRGNPNNITGIRDLVEKPLRIGVADPETAPFGRIAVEILKRASVYEYVRDRLITYSDVGLTARQLALGLVDVAILPYTAKYWFPEELDLVWFSPEEIRGLVSCQLVAVISFSKNREPAEVFISNFTAWLAENSLRLGYISKPVDIVNFTPYNIGDLDLPKICLQGVRG